MADHRPWLKLWTKALGDPDLSRLTMEDRGRWLWLLLLVGANGERGTLTLKRGLGELSVLLAEPAPTHVGATADPLSTQVRPKPRDLRRLVARLPGIELRDADFPDAGVLITFTKWSKYQVDDSSERTRRWRQSKRNGDGNAPSHGDADSPSQHRPGDGARREKTRQEPPYPRDPDTNPDHLRFNIPDR